MHDVWYMTCKDWFMWLRVNLLLVCILAVLAAISQEPSQRETNLAGVFQGETLFIQNPFIKESMSFCIREIRINEKPVAINYDLSAIKLDFTGYDPFTPVKIKVIHSDTICRPVIVNPEAVLFHTNFRFSSIQLTDSALVWSTKGEKGRGSFEVEKLSNGFWDRQDLQEGSGQYEGATYTYFPSMGEGANKYRVKYTFPRGSRIAYLYSQELELEYYPEKVEFSPKSAKTHLYLSRVSRYEIYDQGSNLVLKGQGKEVDVRVLRKGRYVIYFDGRFPGGFNKE